MTVKLINLTPLTITVHGTKFDGAHDPGVLTLPSAGNAWVEETRSNAGWLYVDGVCIEATSTNYGEVTGLPESQDGVVFVVSFMVRSALPHRTDLASPGPLIRDEAGRVVGCQGLTMSR